MGTLKRWLAILDTDSWTRIRRSPKAGSTRSWSQKKRTEQESAALREAVRIEAEAKATAEREAEGQKKRAEQEAEAQKQRAMKAAKEAENEESSR